MGRQSNTVEPIHLYNINLKSREIWLNSDNPYKQREDLTYLDLDALSKNLSILKSSSASKPAIIHLQTAGGDIDAGFGIYDTIRAMPFHISIIGYACIGSMGGIIFQAGDSRSMMPCSTFMFHRGSASVVDGTQKEIKSILEVYSKYTERMLDIMASKCKKGNKFKSISEKRIRSVLSGYMDKKEDVYLSPEEAIEWGLADSIYPSYSS